MPREYAIRESLLDRLFPFFLGLNVSNDARIESAGPTVTKLIGDTLSGKPFDDVFQVTRPRTETLTSAFVEKHTNSLVFIQCLQTGSKIRGQFAQLDDHTVLFVGTLIIESSKSIEEAGLKLGDFAPHDITPDITIYHRCLEMQIADLERQKEDLQKALQERDTFSYHASTDSLTGLTNRRAFWECCKETMNEQETDRILAVIVIDLDGFKAINDRFGHHAGDEVLRVVAQRLQDSLQPTDTAGRLGGDEFAILVQSTDLELLEKRIRQLERNLNQATTIDGYSVTISASLGATLVNQQRSLDELISDADIAMYAGRRAGPGQTTWFVSSMRKEQEEYQALTQDLRQALDDGTIRPAFQPVVSLQDQTIVGFEALARWTHPERGNIPPDQFIDLAQRAGLVPQLDELILRKALSWLRTWRQQGFDVGMQVNLSGLSIRPELISSVKLALDDSQVEARHLTLELTETWLIHNEGDLSSVLNELADTGIRLHLDDFGTGYSSLTHLQAFPINGIKIDRSFVAESLTSLRSRKLIGASMAIAQTLDLEDVVAEGIETQEQADLLIELGCKLGQGYLYSPPVPGEQVVSLLTAIPLAA